MFPKGVWIDSFSAKCFSCKVAAMFWSSYQSAKTNKLTLNINCIYTICQAICDTHALTDTVGIDICEC